MKVILVHMGTVILSAKRCFSQAETITPRCARIYKVELLEQALTKVIQRDMWLKEDFETTIDMPFEDMMIPVPIGYDRILKQIYGDYMKFPPLDKRQGKHDVIYKPDTPYKEYCRKKFGVKY